MHKMIHDLLIQVYLEGLLWFWMNFYLDPFYLKKNLFLKVFD